MKQGSPYTVITARDRWFDFFFLLQGSSKDHARVVQATSLIACHTVIVIVNGKVSGCDLSSQKSITVSKGSQVHKLDKVDEAAVTHGPRADRTMVIRKATRHPWDDRMSEGKIDAWCLDDPAYSKGRVPHPQIRMQ